MIDSKTSFFVFVLMRSHTKWGRTIVHFAILTWFRIDGQMGFLWIVFSLVKIIVVFFNLLSFWDYISLKCDKICNFDLVSMRCGSWFLQASNFERFLESMAIC